MWQDRFNQIRRELKRALLALSTGASRYRAVFMAFLLSFAGLELIMLHAAFLLSYWERVLQVPAVITALSGILLGGNMLWIYLMFGQLQDATIERIRFSCAVDLLLALFGLALWVVWVARYAAWSFDALIIVVLQTLDILLTLWLVRFLRVLSQAGGGKADNL